MYIWHLKIKVVFMYCWVLALLSFTAIPYLRAVTDDHNSIWNVSQNPKYDFSLLKVELTNKNNK